MFTGDGNNASEWRGLFTQYTLEVSKRLLFPLNLDHDADAVVEDETTQTQTQSLGVDKRAEAYSLYDALYDYMKSLACYPA